MLLKKQGKIEEAEPLYRKSLLVQKNAFGEEHPDTLGMTNNLAALLEKQGKLEEAEFLHRKCLAGQKRVLGGEHPHTLASINNLAYVLKTQGKMEEAETLFRKCVVEMEKVLGEIRSTFDEKFCCCAGSKASWGSRTLFQLLAAQETVSGMKIQKHCIP